MADIPKSVSAEWLAHYISVTKDLIGSPAPKTRGIDTTYIFDFADDAAAAAGGVAVTQVYRTGSVLKVRIA